MIDYTKETALIVYSTKDIVDWLLSMNTHNRNIKRSAVDRLTESLNKGLFILTNQGIGISKTGFLVDGQHRLIAIKNAGYPSVKLLIVTGLDPQSQTVVDTHAKRSMSDVMRLVLNRTVSNAAIAAINIMFNVKPSNTSDGFTYIGKKIPDVHECADALTEKEEIFTSLYSAFAGKVQASIYAAFIEYAERYSLEDACELAEQVKSGTMLQTNDPAYRLREKIKECKGSTLNRADIYSYAVSACIAHAKRQPLSKLYKSSSWDKLPKRNPNK